jgi:hypothetical protein
VRKRARKSPRRMNRMMSDDWTLLRSVDFFLVDVKSMSFFLRRWLDASNGTLFICTARLSRFLFKVEVPQPLVYLRAILSLMNKYNQKHTNSHVQSSAPTVKTGS